MAGVVQVPLTGTSVGEFAASGRRYATDNDRGRTTPAGPMRAFHHFEVRASGIMRSSACLKCVFNLLPFAEAPSSRVSRRVLQRVVLGCMCSLVRLANLQMESTRSTVP
jgi:hypothetical protein